MLWFGARSGCILILDCKILGSVDGADSYGGHIAYDNMESGWCIPTFQKNVLPPFSVF